MHSCAGRGERDRLDEQPIQEEIVLIRERMHRPNDPLYLKGKEAGRYWGSEIAQPAELEHLQRLFEQLSARSPSGWDHYFFDEQRTASEVLSSLAVDITGITPEEIDREEEARAFWEEAVGNYQSNSDLSEPAFLQGFADGGLEIWERTRNKL